MALSKSEIEEIAAELESRRCARDCRHWIDGYVKIMDPGPPPRLIPFRLWPEQVRVLQSMLEVARICVLKARQLGLTWLALAYAVWRMVYWPGYQVVCFSIGEEESKELISRAELILKHLPGWMTREQVKGDRTWRRFQAAGPCWRSTTEAVYVQHPGGLISRMQAFPSTTSASRSYTANLVILDEAARLKWAGKLWSSALGTVSKAGGFGQLFAISTMDLGTLFEVVCREAMAHLNGFLFLFLAWTADPARTVAWREQRKIEDAENHLREYPGTVEDALTMGSMTFFPEFRRQVHVVDPVPIPDWWPRWLANDPGYSESYAWLWLTSDPDGQVYVYREWLPERGTGRLAYSKQAAEVKEKGRVRDELGLLVREEQYELLATGHDVSTAHPETMQTIQDFYEQGFGDGDASRCRIPIMTAPADRARRGAVMHEYLKVYDDENSTPPRPTAKLKIFSSCSRLLEALPRAKKDPTNPEAYAKFDEVHVLDALGYGVVVWHPEGEEGPREPVPPLKKHKEDLAKTLQGGQQRARIV